MGKKYEALTAYKEATDAADELPKDDAIRLGLALNFAVFYFEVLEKKEDAIRYANAAYEDGRTAMNTKRMFDQDKDQNHAAKLSLDALEQNLILWTGDSNTEGASPRPPEQEGT